MYLGGGLPNPLSVGRPGGGLPNPPGCRPNFRQNPPDADPPGPVTCEACWEANTLVNRMTDACENITLPQTSLAGGNKWIVCTLVHSVDRSNNK